MSAVRKLALKIVDAVVRHAPPGNREWTEGLANEIRFIENDWSALAWALGSIRVLFDHRGTPLGSLHDVPAALQRVVESERITAWIYWVFYIPTILCDEAWTLFYRTTWWPERAGCLLAVFSSIAAGIFLLIERRRLKHPPNDKIYDDIVACAQFYRAKLEREWLTRWSVACGLVGPFWGLMLADGGGDLRGDTVWSAVYVLVAALVYVPSIRAVQRKNQRAIERLDALLAERS